MYSFAVAAGVKWRLQPATVRSCGHDLLAVIWQWYGRPVNEAWKMTWRHKCTSCRYQLHRGTTTRPSDYIQYRSDTVSHASSFSCLQPCYKISSSCSISLVNPLWSPAPAASLTLTITKMRTRIKMSKMPLSSAVASIFSTFLFRRSYPKLYDTFFHMTLY